MKRVACATVLTGLIVVMQATWLWAVPELGRTPAHITLQAEHDTAILNIYNHGDGVLSWNITSNQPWLSVGQSSGTNECCFDNRTKVTVMVDRTGFVQGSYSGELTITSNGGEATTFVTMIVQIDPELNLSPSTVHVSLNLPTHTFTVHNGGIDPLTWSASGDQPWFDIVPSSGTVPALASSEVSVVLNPGALPSQNQEHTGGIFVTSNGGDGSIAVVFVPVWDEGGILGVYADNQGTDCNIIHNGPGLVSLPVVHTYITGASAIQFSAPKPECWTNATFLSDTDQYPVAIGNSQIGKAVGYGACLSGPVVVTSINYFVQDPAGPTCCEYPALPDPNVPSGEIEVVDCADGIRFGLGRTSIVNPDATCFCGDDIVRVEETTWGRLKALYAPDSDGQ